MLKSVKKRFRSRIRRRKHTLAFLKVGYSEILLSGYKYQVSISCSALLSSEHLELGTSLQAAPLWVWGMLAAAQVVLGPDGAAHREGKKIWARGVSPHSFPTVHSLSFGSFKTTFIPGKEFLQVACSLLGCFSLMLNWKDEVRQDKFGKSF